MKNLFGAIARPAALALALAAPASAQVFGPGFDASNPLHNSVLDPDTWTNPPHRPGPETSHFGDPTSSGTARIVNQLGSPWWVNVNGHEYHLAPGQHHDFAVSAGDNTDKIYFRIDLKNPRGPGVYSRVWVHPGRTGEFSLVPGPAGAALMINGQTYLPD